MNSIIMLPENRVFSFLNKGKILAQLDEDTRAAAEQQALRLDDHTLYCRKNIKDLSGTQDLFTGGDTASQGIRNFNNKQLPKYEHMVVAGVKIGVAELADVSPAKVANYLSKRSSFPHALANGKLIVSQNDNPLFELEIFRATTAGDAASAVGNQDIFPLQQMKLIKADVPFTWQIKFAEGETVTPLGTATDNVHLEVALIGWKTKLD